VPESPTVTIRRATAADLQGIGRLGALLVRTPYLGTQLNEPNVVVLVAERGECVVGYTYAGVEGMDYMALRGPAGAIYDVVVDPDHRGRGIGRLLLDATIALLEERGVPRLVLSTAEQNQGAQRLFDRAGFRRTMIEMTRESTR
jgi:ribosomal protein S18 acetylase RimI-like enzyme